jgi:hypothetical protein
MAGYSCLAYHILDEGHHLCIANCHAVGNAVALTVAIAVFLQVALALALVVTLALALSVWLRVSLWRKSKKGGEIKFKKSRAIVVALPVGLVSLSVSLSK